MPNTEITEFLIKKTRATPGISKQSVIAGYYPTLSLSAGYNYIGVHKCLGKTV
jgi:hypothetical protein